ncbi:indolepyruvate ferredoxin oxidoreductase family protein [Rhodococcus rhodnii]|nr:indolepyruvate ferredoxin oxidoreductase family protein [Rhodococcus rhodnii]TXG89330.1 indolepyruvate ferredoxin oxidoreductase family protein [Rhodococcus rhodnii]
MTQLYEPHDTTTDRPVSAPGAPSPDMLSDRYRPGARPALLSGVQAIGRALVEQHALDLRAGRTVATFVSGYQGSPLAGVDKMLTGIDGLTGEHDVHFVPGLNEELAATAVWGSQNPIGGQDRDGVVGVWYGKGPGLDRSGDAMRHGSMYGAHPSGGVLAYVGDDPASKSSTVPAASERLLAALDMPVLFPRDANEIVAFSLHGIALSRASGCWVGMKIVSDVADGLSTYTLDTTALGITVPQLDWNGSPWRYEQRVLAAPPDSLLAEAALVGPRWAMVEAYGAANDLDSLDVDPADAWLAIVAPGTAYDAVRQALRDLGLGDAELERAGVRLLRVGMPYPLGGDRVRRAARGVAQVLVVEEKSPFVERQVRDALYDAATRPAVHGRRGADGTPLIPADGELTADRLAAPLRAVLGERLTLPRPRPPRLELTVLPTARTASFCSGCPHNRSTVVPDGSLAAGGIGCHTMVTMSSRPDVAVTGLTQMGGEGAQWIGQAPFTSEGHIFQNLGDGTYFHSGQLAVQAAVAAGVNVTYKLLYNGAVAMTGAQHPEGERGIAELTLKLAADGVRRIVVCSDEPRRHRGSRLAAGTLVWDRDRLDEAQRMLRDEPGVTVLIYDQHCAADVRRQRKRGTMPVRSTRVVINEAVCEGCGDCGVKSNCLSVQPVETEFGRKTRIDQTSCNTDYSCLDGNCPSFVTVEAPDEAPERTVTPPPHVPDPAAAPPSRTWNVFLAGIGGTGIVTVNQVLATAAASAGYVASGLDQTGLSQKAGPVTSHLKFSVSDLDASNRVGAASADCVLAFDLLTAADARWVDQGDAQRTVTVASTSRTPTGAMIHDASLAYPDESDMLARLDARCARLVTMDALAAAQRLFGDTTTANFLLVGAAVQSGAVPLEPAAIERAITVNGVSVEENLAAFGWGRAAVADPAAFARATDPLRARAEARPVRALDRCTIEGPVRALVDTRAADLVRHTGERLARRYVDAVQRAWDAERRLGERTDFSAALARGWHKLAAYKDEYEVAALLTDPAFTDTIGRQVPGASRPTFRLHPPLLKALGREGKIGFSPRTHGALRVLAGAKRLRGTVLDPFGHTAVRKLERALIAHYDATTADLATRLTERTYDEATATAAAADLVRGYEEVKLRSVVRYVDRLTELGVAVPVGITGPASAAE